MKLNIYEHVHVSSSVRSCRGWWETQREHISDNNTPNRHIQSSLQAFSVITKSKMHTQWAHFNISVINHIYCGWPCSTSHNQLKFVFFQVRLGTSFLRPRVSEKAFYEEAIAEGSRQKWHTSLAYFKQLRSPAFTQVNERHNAFISTKMNSKGSSVSVTI